MTWPYGRHSGRVQAADGRTQQPKGILDSSGSLLGHGLMNLLTAANVTDNSRLFAVDLLTADV